MFDFDSNNRKLLGKIGFLALRNGMTGQGEIIFSALAATAPEKGAPVIGLAMLDIAQKKYVQAVNRLEKWAAKTQKRDDMVQAYMGMALYFDKQMNRAEKILQHVVDNGNDAEAKKLGQTLLGEMKRA